MLSNLMRELFSINGQLSTKLVFGALSFFVLMGIMIYGTLTQQLNNKFDVILFVNAGLTTSLFGISSFDVNSAKKHGAKNE